VAAKLNQLNLDKVDASKTAVGRLGVILQTLREANATKATVNNWSRLTETSCQIKPTILLKTHCKQLIVYDGCWVTQPLEILKPLPRPKLLQQISLGSVRICLNGWAVVVVPLSW